MKKVLISGGAGFIGFNLARHPQKLGLEVTVLDNLSLQIHENGSNPYLIAGEKYTKTIKYIQGDVTNKKDWLVALVGQDAIVHLAAETGTGQSMYEIEKYTGVNIGGTSLLLDILSNRKHTIKKIVVASSRSIYGEGRYYCLTDGMVYPEARKEEDMMAGDYECKCPACGGTVKLMATDEGSKLHPSSIYGISKQSQEQLILNVCRTLNISAVALRYQNVYGPGQSLSNPYTGILSIFSTQILNNNNIDIYEDGKESRDFVYIDDVVHATTIALLEEIPNQQVFNVGSNEVTDVVKVATLLREAYKSDVDIKISKKFRLGDIRHNVADLSKIQSQLGYNPTVNFEEGIKRFCNWVQTQKINSDKYNQTVLAMEEKRIFKQAV